MISFCPWCNNMLRLRDDRSDTMKLACRTCPYRYHVTTKIIVNHPIQNKPIDDIRGGAEAWKNVDSTEKKCDKCGHNRAYFLQIQTRSADEPSTEFYRCCNEECQNQWKENN